MAGRIIAARPFRSANDLKRVSGIGDKAFLWGARIYALSGNRQLMVNLDKHELTPDVRTTLTSLGKLGVPRLK